MTENEVDKLTSRLFQRLGLPVNRAGYKYLRCAMYILLADGASDTFELKELYWQIARRCNTTQTAVECTMRRTVDLACYQGDIKVTGECFGKEYYDDDVRPTAKQFLTSIRDKLRRMAAE